MFSAFLKKIGINAKDELRQEDLIQYQEDPYPDEDSKENQRPGTSRSVADSKDPGEDQN